MTGRSQKGVTLIEVLLGLGITALIFAILLAALRLGQRSGEKGAERQELSQRMRILSDRISWLLRGAYPYIVAKSPDEKTLYFEGASDSVGFVTTSTDIYSGEPEDKAGLKWVRLSADFEGLKVKEQAYYSEDVLEDSSNAASKEYILDDSVRRIEISYLDAGGEGKETEWVSSWDPKEKQYLPSAVKVEVSMQYRGRQAAVPPIIAAIRAGHKITLKTAM